MAKVYKKKNGRFVIVNELFEELPVDGVDRLFNFHNDIVTFRVNTPDGKKFGYMNVKGEKITSNLYDHAEDFGTNYGLVKNGSKQNLIDRNGNEVFDWKYIQIYSFLRKTFIVQNTEGYYGLIDAKDNILLGFIYTDLFSITHDAKHIVIKWPIFDRSFFLSKNGVLLLLTKIITSVIIILIIKSYDERHSSRLKRETGWWKVSILRITLSELAKARLKR